MTTSSDRKSTADTPGRPSLSVSVGHRIPVPPRERKPAMAALAVLLIVGGALVSAYLVMVSGQRVPVIRVAEPVAAGRRIPASALEEVQVSAAGGVDYIPWADRDKVARTYATVPLVKGSLLTNGMISTSAAAAKGTVVVGLALKPGQFPAGGLRPGDRVALYAVAGSGGQSGVQVGTTLSPAATVYDVARPGRDDVQSDQVQVSVTVPVGEAPDVTQAASAGAVAVAVLAPGEQAPGRTPRQRPEPTAGAGRSPDRSPDTQPTARRPTGQPTPGGSTGRP